jgi:hypothetical protein
MKECRFHLIVEETAAEVAPANAAVLPSPLLLIQRHVRILILTKLEDN